MFQKRLGVGEQGVERVGLFERVVAGAVAGVGVAPPLFLPRPLLLYQVLWAWLLRGPHLTSQTALLPRRRRHEGPLQ